MYFPEKDSFFLVSCLKKYLKEKKDKRIKILDMGSGTGIQAQTCKTLGFKDILCADIDKESVKYLKEKNFNAVYSNLFSNNKIKKFDLIIFNPPYLPEDKYDKEKDTTGGKKGYETILRFLKQAKSHLTKQGKILLLFSSLSHPEIIKKFAEKEEYKINLLDKTRIFFEELYVYELF